MPFFHPIRRTRAASARTTPIHLHQPSTPDLPACIPFHPAFAPLSTPFRPGFAPLSTRFSPASCPPQIHNPPFRLNLHFQQASFLSPLLPLAPHHKQHTTNHK